MYAGEVGVSPHGLTLAELWLMAYGRRRMVREWVYDQSKHVWRDGTLDVEAWIERGEWDTSDAAEGTATIHTEEMQDRIAVTQGCWNRGIPLPDFDSETWRDDIIKAFTEYDAKRSQPQPDEALTDAEREWCRTHSVTEEQLRNQKRAGIFDPTNCGTGTGRS